MKKAARISFFACVIWMTAIAPLAAEPYFAFREGYKCSECHVNRTGGGKRTNFGVLFTQTEFKPLLEKLSEKSGDFSVQAGPSFSLGADFMSVHEMLFKVDEKLNVKTDKIDTTYTYKQGSKNTFDIRSGSLYLEAHLVPEHLSLYVDEIFTPAGAQSREAVILLQKLPHNGYVKAGRMLLPYGIRVWDDEAFIRQATGFNYDNQDLGVEVGIEPGNTSLSIAFSNGTQGARDDNKGKQISSVGMVFVRKTVLGGSFAFNKSRGIKRLVAGPFAGLTVGPATLMGELDWIRDKGPEEQQQLVAFASLDYWVRQSMNFRVAYDFLDPYYKYKAVGETKSKKLEEDEKSRVVVGVDAFLTPFLSAGIHYKLKSSIPQDIAGNADALTIAAHAFF